MKKKTSEPKPVIALEHENGSVTEIYILDDGDTMATNSSSHYDHHFRGPGIVKVTKGRNHWDTYETYVNEPQLWHWIESLMRLGAKYLDEHPEFDNFKHQEEIREEFETRKPWVSRHKKK